MIAVYVAIICVIVATVSSVWTDIKKIKITSTIKNELIKFAQEILIPSLHDTDNLDKLIKGQSAVTQTLDMINKEKEELFSLADDLIHSQETHIEDLNKYIIKLQNELDIANKEPIMTREEFLESLKKIDNLVQMETFAPRHIPTERHAFIKEEPVKKKKSILVPIRLLSDEELEQKITKQQEEIKKIELAIDGGDPVAGYGLAPNYLQLEELIDEKQRREDAKKATAKLYQERGEDVKKTKI